MIKIGTCVKGEELLTELPTVIDAGLKIGIENAYMNGFWYRATCNIGFCPSTWDGYFLAIQKLMRTCRKEQHFTES